MRNTVYLVYGVVTHNGLSFNTIESKITLQVCGSEEKRDKYIKHYEDQGYYERVHYEEWRVME